MVKKVNLAEPGPSFTVPQNGETFGLCNGGVEEAKWVESSNNIKLIYM